MRLAYAGESTIERRRVVNDEGRDESEREKEVSEEGLGWELGSGSETESSAATCQENSSMSRLFARSFSCWRILPIPMLLWPMKRVF